MKKVDTNDERYAKVLDAIQCRQGPNPKSLDVSFYESEADPAVFFALYTEGGTPFAWAGAFPQNKASLRFERSCTTSIGPKMVPIHAYSYGDSYMARVLSGSNVEPAVAYVQTHLNTSYYLVSPDPLQVALLKGSAQAETLAALKVR